MDEYDYGFMMDARDDLETVARRGIETVDGILLAMKEPLRIRDMGVHSIRECIEEAIEQEHLRAEQRNNLRLQIEETVKLKCSKLHTVHMFMNLLRNAYTYGGSKVKVEIWNQGNQVHIKDDGLGIKAEELGNIFEEFYTSCYGNMGIGLTFCRRLMQEMGGEIECYSEVGKYTEFILTFPQANVEEVSNA